MESMGDLGTVGDVFIHSRCVTHHSISFRDLVLSSFEGPCTMPCQILTQHMREAASRVRLCPVREHTSKICCVLLSVWRRKSSHAQITNTQHTSERRTDAAAAHLHAIPPRPGPSRAALHCGEAHDAFALRARDRADRGGRHLGRRELRCEAELGEVAARHQLDHLRREARAGSGVDEERR